MSHALRALLGYAVLTVVMTWPFATHLRIMDPGDSAYFAWAIGWEVHAIKTDPASLPHGNIFHPARYTIFMDEPILGTTLTVLPFALFTDDAVLLFNLARLLTFVLSGLGAYLLARELGVRGLLAFVAGAAFAFSPIRTDQISHLSTLGSQWLPYVALFTIRFARGGRATDALLAGLSFALAAWACGYHGIFGLLVLPLFALPLLWGRWSWLPRAIPAVLVAGALLLPLRSLHAVAFEAEGFSRPLDHAVFHSASIESFFATSSWNNVWGELTAPNRTMGSNNLFPGLLVPLAVLAAAGLLLRRRERPSREALAFLVMLVAGVIVCLGPEVRLQGETLFHGPYHLVRETIPMFQGVRVNSRAGIFLALAFSGLLALALKRLAPSPRVTGLLLGGLLLEASVAPIPIPRWMQVIDSSQPAPAWVQWLAEQPGEFPIAHMPLLPTDGLFRRPHHEETVYMVWSTWHFKRLVNGNAGVEPATYRHVREVCRRFPATPCLDALKELGTRYVLVHEKGWGPNQLARVQREWPAAADRLPLVKDFGAGDRVHELR
jgi:hypothetical protein